MTVDPNGTVTRIAAGGYELAVTEVGGGILSLRHAGRDLVLPYPPTTIRPNRRGGVLAPWPNRLAGGRYTFDGVTQQTALSEPDKGNAIHGLVSWAPFAPTDVGPDHVTLATRLFAQKGYPATVDVTVAYELGEQGLRCEITGTNVGATAGPWGAALHPYLVGGPGRADDWTLLAPASRYQTVDAHAIPVATVDVTPELDFRTARRVGATTLDYAYTGFTGRRFEVRGADGTGVALEIDDTASWVQVFTGDSPDPAADRAGIAVEAMTCPADAYNSGTDLVTLLPGASHVLRLWLTALT